MPALATTAPNTQCVVEAARLVLALDSIGVDVQYTSLPDGELADWDPVTLVLHIRADAPIEHRRLAMRRYWDYFNLGPEAAPDVHRVPRLTVVPAQRPAS